MSKVETVGGPPPVDDVRFLVSIEQLSESRSDGVSTRRLSEDSRSGLTRKEAPNASIFLPKKLFCKETLGNPCITWLPMLYYEGSRLNGLWNPFGIETTYCQLQRASDD